MSFLRNHWYDLGGLLGIGVLVYLLRAGRSFTPYEYLMWLSLVALFCHQLEEYRVVGTFPGMVNRVIYQSGQPDRYPLNAQTALVINVVVGWLFYFLAAVLGERAVWLGIASMLVSLGNTIAHTLVFNLKGKTLYNAGLATCWLLFVPCISWFLYLLAGHPLARPLDYLLGIPVGLALNYVGIIKLIDWMKDPQTAFPFPPRNLLAGDRPLP